MKSIQKKEENQQATKPTFTDYVVKFTMNYAPAMDGRRSMRFSLTVLGAKWYMIRFAGSSSNRADRCWRSRWGSRRITHTHRHLYGECASTITTMDFATSIFLSIMFAPSTNSCMIFRSIMAIRVHCLSSHL